MHVNIVLCCGVKTVLFTNKLSECWCHIINPYLFTKFHTSKHLGKRVTQTCMFTLFFVVVRKGYCLPTSYQNVGVVSVIPTCLQMFMHPSILVRELHKDAFHIVLCCGVKRVLFTNMLSECWCRTINPYLFTKFHTSKHLGKRVEPPKGARPLKGATPRRGVWRRSRPLFLLGWTAATGVPDLAVSWNRRVAPL